MPNRVWRPAKNTVFTLRDLSITEICFGDFFPPLRVESIVPMRPKEFHSEPSPATPRHRQPGALLLQFGRC